MVALERREDALQLAVEKTRLVVLGDPHGDVAGLDAVERAELPSARTAFVSAGDNVGYGAGPESSALCQRLEAAGIASVYGNHEAWMGEDGALPIVADRSRPRTLSADALRFCRALPLRILVGFDARPSLRVALVHTLVEPEEPLRWPFVDASAAPQLPELARATVVFVGHSHGPAIYALERGRLRAQHRLDLTARTPHFVRVPLEPGRRYVVDAGSLARPGYHPEPGRFDLATWAALDLTTDTLSLHAAAKYR